MAELDETGLDDDDVTAADLWYFMGWHLDSQRRIYDVLLTILAQDDKAAARKLQAAHEQGKFLYPPPWHDDDNADKGNDNE